jgi:hypothetical protein
MLIEQLLDDYDPQWKQFNLDKLVARQKVYAEDKPAFTEELRKLIATIYQSIENNGEMKLVLVKAIATSFDAQVSHQVLAVFMHLHHLLERYALNISAKRIFAIDCLLHETSLANLF